MRKPLAFSGTFICGQTLLLSSFFLLACDGSSGELNPAGANTAPSSAQDEAGSASGTGPTASSPDSDAVAPASSGGKPRLAGICILREESSSLPALFAPDVGPGYAKYLVPGHYDLAGLKVACTSAIFQTLLSRHCAKSTNRVQATIALYNPDLSWNSTTCGALGCNFRYCPGTSADSLQTDQGAR